MTEKGTGTSPRLQRLQKDLESGNSGALQQFWDEIKAQGAPLVEEIEGEKGHRLVTFLWQASMDLINVSLVSLMTASTTYLMKRLSKTDIWYVTLRLPSDLRATYQFFPNEVTAPGEKSSGPLWSYYKPDPLNSHSFAFYTKDEDPTEVKLTRSVLELPNAPPQPWIKPREDVSKGKVHLHTLSSDILGNERRVWVYSPAKYTAGLGQPYPLLVLFDGWAYANLIPTFTILDNMIADRIIRPTVAVLVDSLDAETRMKEMVFHQPFNAFLNTELLPWIMRQYSVSTEAAETVVGGSSAGGLAAAYAALENPDVFGNVLSQSGAFTINPSDDKEGYWLARQFEQREKLPLSFHLDAGTLEVNSYRELRGGVTPLEGNRHMRDTLLAKGYDVHYTEFSGGHDYISWQGTIGNGLAYLLG